MAVSKSNPVAKVTKAMKQYHSGTYGPYTVIANRGDSEAAVSFSLVAGDTTVKTVKGSQHVPAFGLGFRIRFYDRDGTNANPFPGFKGVDQYGSRDGAPCYRIKKFIPVSHQGLGVYGLSSVWRSKSLTKELIASIKDAVKKSKGKMVVSDAQLTVLIEQGFEGVPLKAPNVFAGFDLSTSNSGSFSGKSIPHKKHPQLVND